MCFQSRNVSRDAHELIDFSPMETGCVCVGVVIVWSDVVVVVVIMLLVVVVEFVFGFASPLVLFVVCGMNLMLVIDITKLLNPMVGHLIGSPTRPEYVLGLISLLLIIMNFATGEIGFKHFVDVMKWF